jgi:hypothetical protein
LKVQFPALTTLMHIAFLNGRKAGYAPAGGVALCIPEAIAGKLASVLWLETRRAMVALVGCHPPERPLGATFRLEPLNSFFDSDQFPLGKPR